MVTYKQIQEDVKSRNRRTVKTCWIAHVKELNGMNPRKASNRLSAKKRTVPCPAKYQPLIEASMRRFRML